MYTLESPVMTLEECIKLEDKIFSLGADFKVLEDYFRQLVEDDPRICNGPELISEFGPALVDTRIASKAEVEAGGCSPVESLSFLGTAVWSASLFSDWSHNGSLWPAVETALASGSPREFELTWYCTYAHIPPHKLPAKFRLEGKSKDSLPGIYVSQDRIDVSIGDALGKSMTRTGVILMSRNCKQDYWKHHPEKYRVALEKIRSLPEVLPGWENATFSDAGRDSWGQCTLVNDSAEELYANLTAAVDYCFGDGLSTMEQLQLSVMPDAARSKDRSRDAMTKFLATVSGTDWSHWQPWCGVMTAKGLWRVRNEISHFPVVLEGKKGISIPISSIELAGESIYFSRSYKQGGNVLSAHFLRRRKISPSVHKELEEILGIPLALPDNSKKPRASDSKKAKP